MIKVTLEFATQAELLAFFNAPVTPAVQAEASQAIEKAAKTPKAAKAADPKPAPTAEAKAESSTAAGGTSAPAPASESAPQTITLEEVRAKLAALSQAGKQTAVKELITALGATKLTDIKAEQYPELLAKAAEL